MTTSLLARYRVRDIEAFRAVFDDFEGTRRAHGSTGHALLVAGPHDVIAIIDFPDGDAARGFAAAPERAEALDRAGVKERQDVVGDLVERVAYSNLRDPATAG